LQIRSPRPSQEALLEEDQRAFKRTKSIHYREKSMSQAIWVGGGIRKLYEKMKKFKRDIQNMVHLNIEIHLFGKRGSLHENKTGKIQ
jgi:hypothetical protein